MSEDFLKPSIIKCNMASIVHTEEPRLPHIARPTMAPQESRILINLHRNTLTYKDHSERETIPIAWARFSMDSISVTLERSIDDTLP